MPATRDSNSAYGRDVDPASMDSTYLRYSYVQFITEHLADCSRVFRGDLQEMLVLAVIGQHAMDEMLGARVDKGPRSGGSGMSASRIADVTGIPRETVRRKLRSLAGRGWVEQHRSSSWRLVFKDGRSVAGVQLAELDARGIERAEHFLKSVARR